MKGISMTIAALLALVVPGLAREKIAGVQRFSFEKCEIICLQDAKMSTPRKLFADAGNTGFQKVKSSYEASLNVFLGRQDGKVFLIDAGNSQDKGSLRKKLELAGVPADSVTDIFITHIHPDHVGGLLWNEKPLFPNATLHIAREEYETWRQDSNRRALARFISPYSQRLDEFDYEKPLPYGLVPLKRGGHTPGHTIFRLALDDKTEAVFVGDIAHGAGLQFPYPTFCARYDAAPKEAVESRIQTLQMKGILFGAHFPFPGTAQGGIVLKTEPAWSFSYRIYK